MTQRPNILWISFEDTTPRFGCYGDKLACTPALDALAAQGVRYANAFTTAPVSAPARAAVITGMYATSIGAHHMRTSHTNPATPEMVTPYDALAPHYVRCFSEYFRAAGYYCTNNAKTDYQFHPPLTAWDRCARGAHWRTRPNGSPFFAVFNLDDTHESGQWPEKGREPRTDPAAVSLPPYLPDTLEGRKCLARQYDHIADNDAIVARLLGELEADGLADNTIVVIWSDHGEGLPRSKRWPYDTGLRVPLIVRWPGQIAASSVDPRLVSTVDLAPTMLSLCGLEVPSHLQGTPFLGPHAKEREYIYASRDRYDEAYDMVRAVRDRRYKYIRNFRPELPRMLWIPYSFRHPIMQEIWARAAAGTLAGPQRWFAETSRPVEELYDLECDPWELVNLAADPAHAATRQRLSAALMQWCEDVGDLGHLDETELAERSRPGGQARQAAPVVFVPLSAERHGTEVASGGALRAPVLLQLHCPTQGASIVWTSEAGAEARWKLYAGPLNLPKGTTTLRARAARIGFNDGPERQASFTIV